MYTSGHEELLLAALKIVNIMITDKFSDDMKEELIIKVLDRIRIINISSIINKFKLKDVFKFTSEKGYVNMLHITLDKLKTGLFFPDFPCSKLFFDTADKKVKIRHKLCSLLKLVDDIEFKPNFFSLAYTSHNGFYSIWHSMTYLEDILVEDLVSEIKNDLKVFSFLGIRDDTFHNPMPNITWIGRVLHTVMDSYSTAHTLRQGNFGKQKETECPQNGGFNTETKEPNKVILETVQNLKKVASSENFTIVNMENCINTTIQTFKEHHPNIDQPSKETLQDLLLYFRFRYVEEKNMDRIFENQTITDDKKVTVLDKIINSHYRDDCKIMNFYFYPSQRGLFHKDKDRMEHLHTYNLYKNCVLDCAYILFTYFSVLNDNYNIHKEKFFVTKIEEYLKSKTFSIPDSCLKQVTGKKNTKKLTAGSKHIYIQGKRYRIYEGSRGGKFIKKNGKTVYIAKYLVSGLQSGNSKKE